ncbi:MAG TPA: FKBP-type peptidyl-prolyl cis-trans isomerase [Marmoricola sp.]|nr:FKBP-type peptidyl-prolyl cis-trans isomerase [Marmoricola sp.]
MFRTLPSRRLAPVALLAAAALLLTGCGSDSKSTDKTSSTASSSPSASTSATTDANGCGTYAAGKVSDGVKVAGDFGKTQTATFGTPLKATDLERTIATKGTGAATAAGQKIDSLISIYLGKDGKALGSQQVSLTVGDPSMIKAFAAGIDCVPIGSRVVVTAPAKDMYGDQGNAQLGISGTDSLVIVTDVIGVHKQLVPQAWKTNVPKVTFDAQGKPTVKLPKSAPPKQLMLKVLKPGSGDVVKSGDTVTLNYQGTSWDTGKIFDQSYGKQPATFGTDQVVEGFGAALVGQKVGTRLIVTIPPQYAYGTDKANDSSGLAGQTLVFVIDIQKTASGAQ